MTSAMSTPPSPSHSAANSLANEIIVASTELDAYLIISAVLQFVVSTGTPVNGAYKVR